MSDFSGKVAVITGAVGNLGQAVTRAFRQAGARCVLADRANDRLARLYPPEAASDDCLLVTGVDLAEESAAKRLIAAALERFGRIDVLVNTVGGFAGGKKLHEEALATWEAMWRINLLTTLNACRAVVPHFLERGCGRIVNVAARAALSGPAGLAAYSASKSAVVRLTESLAAELKDHGVTVNCVLPGTIDTPQNRAAMPNADFSKWVKPEAIAEVILFLASEAAAAVTGAAVPVYGRS
jgi:NAD(P)-dependent dehydrogenase (short-subunit alcohol dehydrogenase family)